MHRSSERLFVLRLVNSAHVVTRLLHNDKQLLHSLPHFSVQVRFDCLDVVLYVLPRVDHKA